MHYQPIFVLDVCKSGFGCEELTLLDSDLHEFHFRLHVFAQVQFPDRESVLEWHKCRWYLGLRQQHEDLLAGRGSDDEAEAEEVTEEEESQSFARENDLRDFLAKNLNRIEPGLTLYSGDGRSGVEFVIDDGRIDLLTVDREGRLVVIELKVSRGRNKTIGQLLFYMGWVDKNLSKGKKCRGMVIAREITDDLVLAVQRVPGVSLCRYILSVTVEPVAAMTQ